MNQELLDKINAITKETDSEYILGLIDIFKNDKALNSIIEYASLRSKLDDFDKKYEDELHICDEIYLDTLNFNLDQKRKFEQYFLVLNARYYKESGAKREAMPYISRLYACAHPNQYYIYMVSRYAIEIFMEEGLPYEAVEYARKIEEALPSAVMKNKSKVVALTCMLDVYSSIKDIEKYNETKRQLQEFDYSSLEDETKEFLRLHMILDEFLISGVDTIESAREALKMEMKNKSSHTFFHQFVPIFDYLDKYGEKGELARSILELSNSSVSIENRISLLEYLLSKNDLSEDERNDATKAYNDSLKLFHDTIYDVNKKMLQAITLKDSIENEHIQKAYHDSLTGIFNSYAYHYELNNLSNHKEYFTSDLIVVMSDLNYLKKINDTHGHKVGDEMLKKAADALSRAFNPHGIVFRVGGDEFVSIIRCSKERLEEALEKVDKECERCDSDSKCLLSISNGYAMRKEHIELTISELVEVADRMMYEKKKEMHKALKTD